jgi:hypothetical protein
LSDVSRGEYVGAVSLANPIGSVKSTGSLRQRSPIRDSELRFKNAVYVLFALKRGAPVASSTSRANDFAFLAVEKDG